MIGKAHVTAERQSAYYRCFRASDIDKGIYITNSFFFAIFNHLLGIVRLAVAAHIPNDQAMIFTQHINLTAPHCRSRCKTMTQNNERSIGAMNLIVD